MKIPISIAALAFCLGSLAQAAPAASAAAAKAESLQAQRAAYAKAVDEAIPDVVATYGDNQMVKGEEIRRRLKISSLDRRPDRLQPDPKQIKEEARIDARWEIQTRLCVAAALEIGLKPDLEAAKQALARHLAKNPQMTRSFIQAQGMDEDQWARRMADDAVIGKWRASLTTAVMPPEAELQKYYDEHRDRLETRRLAQILAVPRKDGPAGEVTTAAREEARKRLEAVQARLKAGEEFGKLARECSDCPSREKQGDLGSYTKLASPFPPEFNDVAFALKENEVSGIVETPFGYHLIQASHIPTALPAPVRNQILQEQYGRKFQRNAQEKIDELMQKADIKYNL